MLDLLERIRETMQLCEGFPCGGIGPAGPTQGDLDDAIKAGHPIGDDDTYHRAQQIWTNLNELSEMVTLMCSNTEQLSESELPAPFFVTNEYLNKMFPLASCPRGSLDERPEADWYIHDLSSRLLAALFIGDTQTMNQLQSRLTIHRACREAHGIL